MCGIIGICSGGRIDEELLINARDRMSHRGPDDAGVLVWPERGIGLAHRRLSIVDLSVLGHQPFCADGGRYAIVFNGEIYNFKELRRELHSAGYEFRSHTDTEVILAGYIHWGDSVVSRLNGMFAFAIADRRTGRIFLARDRVGEKPLFYYWNGTDFVFASELKGVLAWPFVERKIDIDALNSYLSYGYVPGQDCLLKQARKLAPGATLSFLNGRIDIKQFWTLPQAAEVYKSDEHLLAEFKSQLVDSVKRQLVADVPVGVLLSGGVDSSLVTALAAMSSTDRIKTFTVVFPQNPSMDESAHARLVASAFGTEHHELRADDITPSLVTKLAAQYDEPLADSSMIPTYLVSQLVRSQCTVALGGDGCDELFGGYAHYPRILKLRQHGRRVPSIVRDTIATVASSYMPVGFRGRNYLLSLGALNDDQLPFPATQFDAHARRGLLNPELDREIWGQLRPEESRNTIAAHYCSSILRMTATDFLTYLPDDILVKVDRASMLCSLELRAPFLDYRIIEFAFRDVPDHLKVAGDQKKILPKRLARELLPAEFDMRRKHGFSIPLNAWLRSTWRSRFMEYTADLPPSIIRKAGVDSLWRGQALGCNNAERIYALAMLSLWLKQYNISL